MISLLVRPWDQIGKVTKMLSKELCRMHFLMPYRSLNFAPRFPPMVMEKISSLLFPLHLWSRGALLGTLRGNRREVLGKLTVELPWKHGRGGQSALRFDRPRTESRHYYVSKAAELSIKHFIDPSGESTTRQHRV